MKTVKCSNLCGVELYFSDSLLSKNGKKIPLEVQYQPDDTKRERPQFLGKPHQCPNSNYNRNATANSNNPQAVISKQVPTQISEDYKFQFLTIVDQEIIQANTRYLIETRYLVEKECKDTPFANNPAAIGQFLNLVIQKLENQKKLGFDEKE